MQVTWFLNQNYSSLKKNLAFSFGTLLKELGFVCLFVGLLELFTVVGVKTEGTELTVRLRCEPAFVL